MDAYVRVALLRTIFGSSQHALLQPTFPLYITLLGGTPVEVGLVLACFAVTSVVFRPLIGGWADTWSETGVLICGLCLLSAAVFFCFIPFPEATMFANALRGLGWAGLSAAGYSLLATAPARSFAADWFNGWVFLDVSRSRLRRNRWFGSNHREPRAPYVGRSFNVRFQVQSCQSFLV